MSRYVMGLHGPDGWMGYLLDFDPDYRPGPGSPGHDAQAWAAGRTGRVDVTDDLDDARRFDSPLDVFEAWRQQSTVVPFRDDGEPNRPLTTFTAEVLSVAGALAREAEAEAGR